MTSFATIFNQELEQGKVMAAVDSHWEIKIHKTCALYFVINWNLARYPGTSYCVPKYQKFDHRGTLSKVVIIANPLAPGM